MIEELSGAAISILVVALGLTVSAGVLLIYSANKDITKQ